jgi:hypothetical protein
VRNLSLGEQKQEPEVGTLTGLQEAPLLEVAYEERTIEDTIPAEEKISGNGPPKSHFWVVWNEDDIIHGFHYFLI